jgi:hypothetical protein
VSRIVWLASYPKSGNTWLRAFLANFERDSDTPVDIDDLEGGRISSDRGSADNALGVECSDLTPVEIDRWRPAVYRKLAEISPGTLYLKTHDAYSFNSAAEPLFPADVSNAAVYVVRNPLDVAVSYAHHGATTIDDSIDLMSNDNLTLAGQGDRLSFQLHQRLFSWSRHVKSWLDQQTVPLHLMRYEDMRRQPMEEFARAVRFLGAEEDCERLSRAVAFSSFETLQRQELAHGYREKPRGAPSFFRSGRVGSGREVLTEHQVARIIRDHGAVMRRLGYLSEVEWVD